MWARNQLDQWSKDNEEAKKNDHNETTSSSSSSTPPSAPMRSLSPEAQLWLAQKTQTVKNLSRFAVTVKKTFTQDK